MPAGQIKYWPALEIVQPNGSARVGACVTLGRVKVVGHDVVSDAPVLNGGVDSLGLSQTSGCRPAFLVCKLDHVNDLAFCVPGGAADDHGLHLVLLVHHVLDQLQNSSSSSDWQLFCH